MVRTKTKPFLKRKKVPKFYFHFGQQKSVLPSLLTYTWTPKHLYNTTKGANSLASIFLSRRVKLIGTSESIWKFECMKSSFCPTFWFTSCYFTCTCLVLEISLFGSIVVKQKHRSKFFIFGIHNLLFPTIFK
jgi:hypothetical protein